MMEIEKHKTRKEFAESLGFSVRTLYRRLKKINFVTQNSELLCPAMQNHIRKKLDEHGLLDI